MNTRIKEVRLKAGLKQHEFAECLKVTQSAVAAYEAGIRVPRNATIAAICREFNVREEWLRTGSGPMEPERSREEELAFRFAQAMAEGNQKRMALLSLGLSLSPDQVESIAQLALDLAAKIHECQEKPES